MSTVRVERNQIKFQGERFNSDMDAIKYARENKMRAIKVDGGRYAVSQETANDLCQVKRLVYLTERDGQVMTVPTT